MVKLVIHITKVIVAAIVALLFSSCNNFSISGLNKVEGNGNVVTKTRNVPSNFTAISASRGLEVILEQSPDTKVTVEADENLQSHIKTEVVNGELRITSDANIKNEKAKKVYVSLPKLDSFEASSGSSVSSKNVLKNNAMAFSSSSGSRIVIKVEAETVSCESSSGSSIKISGKASRLDSNSSSGSSIDAKALAVKDAVAESSSGSSITLNTSQSLTAEASSGSSVNYIGTPNNLIKKLSSGGSISQE